MTYTRERYTASPRPVWSPDDLRAEFQRIQRAIPHPTVIDVRDFGWRGNGVTDDYSPIQKAINAANGNGGARVYVPKGISAITSPLVVKSNVELCGAGRATVIKGAFATATNRIITSSDSELQSNVILRDFAVDRSDDNSEHGIILGGIDNLLLDNLYVTASADPGVTSGAIGISVFDEFAALESRNVRVVNCVVDKCNNFGIAFGYVTNGLVSHNHLIDCYREAIGIEGYDAAESTSPEKGNQNIAVVGNTIVLTENSNFFGGSVGPGIFVGGSASEGYVRNVTVSANTILGTHTVASQQYDGITVMGGSVHYAEDIVVSNNTIKHINNRAINVGALGFNTRRVKVSGNHIVDCNLGSNSTPHGAAIHLRNATDCDVTDNKVEGSSHTYVVEETSGADGNAVLNNTGAAGTAGSYALVGASSYVVSPGAYRSDGGGVMRHETVTLADDATHTFSARGTNNRAIYALTTNFNNTASALFIAEGTSSPTVIYSGSVAVFGAANPDTDGAVNIWPASSSTLSIKNRLGSSRVFTLTSMATQ